MINKIVCGDLVFEDKSVRSGNCFLACSLAGDELSIDTLGANLDCSTQKLTIFRPAGSAGMLTAENLLLGVRPWVRLLTHDLSQYSYGQPVYYYHDDVLVGKFFMSSTKRVGKYLYEISCISAIGLLDNSMHYGGLYEGSPMGEILADIVAGAAPYRLDEAFANTPVYGWLPVATRRDNLHQLLFAEGCCVKKDENGDLLFTALAPNTPQDVGDDRMFLGGNVAYDTPATAVSVAEHAYTAYDTDGVKTLYEGEAAAEPITTPRGVAVTGVLVTFSAPVHDLVIENGEILESGVNYAVIAQASDCKLTGREYTHTTRTITRGGTARSLAEQKDNEVSVTDATLVSLLNSENVADRVMAYYGSAKTVDSDIAVGGERPGDAVAFTDPFDETWAGFLGSMDISLSGFLRASAKFIADYTPTDIGNYYQNYVVLTDDGTWQVPAQCKGKIRVVLIGGGQGGASGAQGAEGARASGSSFGASGAGGAGGRPGDGGHVNIVTIPAEAGQTWAVHMGEGGEGGTMAEDGTSGLGLPGGETTFGDYSSNGGRPSETGYTNQMTGFTYAQPGEVGITGGTGQPSSGAGEPIEYKGVTYLCGSNGAGGSKNGQRGAGGLGGGAAAGSDGGNGGDAALEDNNGNGFATGGTGGIGGNGAAGDDATGEGRGGSGGHGGGGGGGGGAVSGSSQYTWPGYGGEGGSGGGGGRGGRGTIIIYW